MASAHSAHASPAVHRRGRPGPAVDVMAVVLAAPSAPPIRPPPTLVGCQCGRPASTERYERRYGTKNLATTPASPVSVDDPLGGVERPRRMVRFAQLIHRRVRAFGPAYGRHR